MRLLTISTLLLTLTAAALADVSDVVVPPLSGNGTCSPGNVTALSFTVTCPTPGLSAVLAASQPAYNALLPANLSDPSSSSLPAPLLDLSCTSPNTTTCAKTFPANRKLRSQVMCILLKNDGSDPLTAHIDVTWTLDTSGGSNDANASGNGPGAGSGAGMLGVSGWMAVLTVVGSVLAL